MGSFKAARRLMQDKPGAMLNFASLTLQILENREEYSAATIEDIVAAAVDNLLIEQDTQTTVIVRPEGFRK